MNGYTEPRVYVSGSNGAEGRIVAAEIEADPGTSALVWSPEGEDIAFRNPEGVFVCCLGKWHIAYSIPSKVDDSA
ncbi:MAG: hypothetical protein ACC700_10335 [Anaerolineales bacterium]